MTSVRVRSGATLDELQVALELVRRACEPGTNREIAAAIAELFRLTKGRVQGDGESKLLAEAMVARLRAYPIDVVRFACEYWLEGGRENRFFPSWPELKEICDKRLKGRICLKRALEDALRTRE